MQELEIKRSSAEHTAGEQPVFGPVSDELCGFTKGQRPEIAVLARTIRLLFTTADSPHHFRYLDAFDLWIAFQRREIGQCAFSREEVRIDPGPHLYVRRHIARRAYFGDQSHALRWVLSVPHRRSVANLSRRGQRLELEFLIAFLRPFVLWFFCHVRCVFSGEWTQ